ncbi:hypothetical protein [Paenarthrobacter nitroguajacolicus]
MFQVFSMALTEFLGLSRRSAYYRRDDVWALIGKLVGFDVHAPTSV